MTIIFNKSNWTGESVTVRVNKHTKQFTFEGDRYRLRKVHEVIHVVEQSGPGGWRPGGWRQVGTVYGPDEGCYAASAQWSDLSRSADCPFKAAVKLLCNT